MANNQIRYVLRKKETGGSNPIPSDVLLGEPLINTYDGILLFSGTPGGIYQPSAGQPGVFEVGSTISNLRVLSGINLNNMFVISASTGEITTYAGQSDLTGYFLSGTSIGFVLAPISSIILTGSSGGSGFPVQNGINIFTAGTYSSQTINITSATLNSLSVSGSSYFSSISAATIFSSSTNLYDIFAVNFDVIDGGSF